MGINDYIPPPPEDAEVNARVEASIKDLVEWREHILAKMRENSFISFTKLVNHDRAKTPIYNSRAVKNIA